MAFDSVQVRFKNTSNIDSPFADTRVVPFIGSYFEILKSVVEDIKTEYFWFFSNFVIWIPNLIYITTNHLHKNHLKIQSVSFHSLFVSSTVSQS